MAFMISSRSMTQSRRKDIDGELRWSANRIEDTRFTANQRQMIGASYSFDSMIFMVCFISSVSWLFLRVKVWRPA